MPVDAHYRPDPRYPSAVGDNLCDVVRAARFPSHALRFRNDSAAGTLGLAGLDDEEWLDAFGRFEPLPGNLKHPLALRYHGHQFQHYNPDLGDGRGFLFAQLEESGTGRLLDLTTKGTGTTPWSRGGDGRLTLQGAVREVLAAEMLQSLGVSTCRILSVVETGESLQRHDEPSPTRAAAMVRVQHSSVRFGSFQRLAYFRDASTMDRLVEWCVTELHPGLADEPDRPAALLGAVRRATAETLGGWLAAGFVHGVLNTDNLNITGESFD
ncbi:MAG: protein adenylyltransferase SelO family protein, partial [Myxococcota bacterium]|nr:protein adenylyltransferase SelO family protein [Myxococcota bacterium]